MKHGVTYLTGSASDEEVSDHLRACSASFLPPLETRVDISQYAAKIKRHAITFEAWSGNSLVGLVAAYLNDPVGHAGFVTSVSVDKRLGGRGIATRLMQMCIQRARALHIAVIRLVVSRGSADAVRLYHKLGFRETRSDGNLVHMELRLIDTQSSEIMATGFND